MVAKDWSQGIAASLRAGVEAADAAGADAALVALGDQPLITPQVVAAVLTLADDPEPAARPTFGGTPGHPVLIKRELFADVGRLRGDAGARDLLDLRGVATVECGHLGSAQDVDTREALEAVADRVRAQ